MPDLIGPVDRLIIDFCSTDNGPRSNEASQNAIRKTFQLKDSIFLQSILHESFVFSDAVQTKYKGVSVLGTMPI